MRRQFRPWFAVVNEDYNQGSSGGGVIPGPDENTLCGEDGRTYMYFDNVEDATGFGVSNYQGVGWYRCDVEGNFDSSYYSSTKPSGAGSC